MNNSKKYMTESAIQSRCISTVSLIPEREDHFVHEMTFHHTFNIKLRGNFLFYLKQNKCHCIFVKISLKKYEEKTKIIFFHVFFHEMAAILDFMILSKEHITSKLLFQTQYKCDKIHF